ncbi:MAG: hypothetical protein DI539_27945, partial [Flavobacterium psychrophilum]
MDNINKKTIAFIDFGYIIIILKNDINIPIHVAIGRLLEKYEIHFTNVVLHELTARDFAGNVTLRNWFDNKENYFIDNTPVSAAFKADLISEGIVSPRNIGEFSLVEAAAKYPSAVVLVDDKFFSRISSGLDTPINLIENKKTAAFAKIAPIFDNVFPKEVASNYLSHAQTLLSDVRNGEISPATLFSSIDTLSNRVYDLNIFKNAPVEQLYADIAKSLLANSGVEAVALTAEAIAFKVASILGRVIDPTDIAIAVVAVSIAAMISPEALAKEFDEQAESLGIGVAATIVLGAVAVLFPATIPVIVAAGIAGLAIGLAHIADLFEEAWPNIRDFLNDMFGSFDALVSPLIGTNSDALVLDLDGDGIELSTLAASNVHFDY